MKVRCGSVIGLQHFGHRCEGTVLHINSDWTAIAKFDGEFAQTAQTYAGTGTLKYSW